MGGGGGGGYTHICQLTVAPSVHSSVSRFASPRIKVTVVPLVVTHEMVYSEKGPPTRLESQQMSTALSCKPWVVT